MLFFYTICKYHVILDVANLFRNVKDIVIKLSVLFNFPNHSVIVDIRHVRM